MRLWACVVVLAACGGAVVQASRSHTESAGAEPRRILRVTPKLHTVENFDVTTKQRFTVRSLDTTFNPHHLLTDLPSMKLAGRSEVVAVDGDGTSHVEVRVDGVELLDDQVDASIRAQLTRQMDKARSSIVRLRITPTGRRAADGEVPEALRGFDEFDPQLPAEPVGVGASWSLDDVATVENIRWGRHAMYRVRALTDHAVTIEVAIAWRAKSQALRVEPLATTRLTSGSGTTTGTITLRFDRAIAASDFHSTLEMNLLIVRRRARVESSVTAESWLTTAPR